MFFLKKLPSQQMVEGYASRYATLDSEACIFALSTMRRASLMVRRLEAYFAEHDLSQLRFLILIVIDREPKRQSLTITEIIDRLDVSKPVMTRTLARLKSDNLIAIDGGLDDGRSKSVRLTQTGRSKLEAVLPEYFSLLSALGRGE